MKQKRKNNNETKRIYYLSTKYMIEKLWFKKKLVQFFIFGFFFLYVKTQAIDTKTSMCLFAFYCHYIFFLSFLLLNLNECVVLSLFLRNFHFNKQNLCVLKTKNHKFSNLSIYKNYQQKKTKNKIAASCLKKKIIFCT